MSIENRVFEFQSLGLQKVQYKVKMNINGLEWFSTLCTKTFVTVTHAVLHKTDPKKKTEILALLCVFG